MKKTKNLLIIAIILTALQILSVIGNYVETNPISFAAATAQGIGASLFSVGSLILIIVVYRQISSSFTTNCNKNDLSSQNKEKHIVLDKTKTFDNNKLLENNNIISDETEERKQHKTFGAVLFFFGVLLLIIGLFFIVFEDIKNLDILFIISLILILGGAIEFWTSKNPK